MYETITGKNISSHGSSNIAINFNTVKIKANKVAKVIMVINNLYLL